MTRPDKLFDTQMVILKDFFEEKKSAEEKMKNYPAHKEIFFLVKLHLIDISEIEESMGEGV